MMSLDFADNAPSMVCEAEFLNSCQILDTCPGMDVNWSSEFDVDFDPGFDLQDPFSQEFQPLEPTDFPRSEDILIPSHSFFEVQGEIVGLKDAVDALTSEVTRLKTE